MSKVKVEELNARGVVGISEQETVGICCEAEAQSDEMAQIRAEIFESAGKIKAAVYSESQGRFLKLIFLKAVKDSGNYKKLGITWSDFCTYVGQDRKRIDDQLADLKPFNAEFLVDFANFTGKEAGSALMTESQFKMILTEAALHVPGSFIEREGVRIGKVALMTCANCMLAEDEATCCELSARDIYVYCSEEFTLDKKHFLCTALKCPSWSQCAQGGVCRECVLIGAYKRRRKLKK